VAGRSPSASATRNSSATPASKERMSFCAEIDFLSRRSSASVKVGCACSGKPRPTSPADERRRRLARDLSRFRSSICCPHASRRDTRPGCLSSMRRSSAWRTGRRPLGMYTSCKAVFPTSLCKRVHGTRCFLPANRIPNILPRLEAAPKPDHFPADCRPPRHAGGTRRCQARLRQRASSTALLPRNRIVSAHPQSSRLMPTLLWV
jgi:hypothetical protein